jgi:beta-lactamase superfamily II metal-dependent hydrolase
MPRAVHLLDVGHINFGDAILCEFDDVSVLIDGARKKSAGNHTVGSVTHVSIQNQIRTLLNKPTAHVDLLVMTHCHADHIGCLPPLIRDGVLTCDWALMADPDLGFGRLPTDPDEPPVDSMPLARKVALALREEPITDSSDEEIERFVEDQAGMFDEYMTLLTTLESRLGDQLVLYRGVGETDSPGLTALLDHFAPVGLRVLGPTRDQLGACAEEIRNRFIDAIQDAEAALGTDAAATPAALYRTLLGRRFDAAIDASREGAALNCQSTVISFEVGGKRVLLTGDMQFAAPGLGAEVGGMVTALTQAIAAAGPYDFVKIAHHASDNAFNADLLSTWGAKLFGISTGSNSSHHPVPSVINLLNAAQDVHWIRNDRNGRCSFRFSGTPLEVQRGAIDNTSGPSGLDDQGPLVPTGLPATPPLPVAVSAADQHIEVVARLPNVRTRVTVTIDVEPAPGGTSASFQRPAASDARLGGGRSLPRLLFVTNAASLARNVGAAESQHAIDLIRQAGHVLVDAAGARPLNIAPAVRAALVAHPDVKGVVVLGGYDVIPAASVDALPPNLRAAASFEEDDDPDDFTVWSDDLYGDREGDEFPELPVSRIPDGCQADLVFTALAAALPTGFASRGGIRNLNRPFAETVYATLPGTEAIVTSDPIRHGRPPAPNLAGHVLYVMLHGDNRDATTFNGEDTTTRQHAAVRLPQFAGRVPPVVFAGCCWGALTVDTLARDHVAGGALGIRGPDQSIALRCLASGANAFVGCTGAHYSPMPHEPPSYGAPMHSYFLKELLSVGGPALALFRAKQEYARHLPHLGSAATDGDRMIEYKTLRQFTCLGLGW